MRGGAVEEAHDLSGMQVSKHQVSEDQARVVGLRGSSRAQSRHAIGHVGPR
jgi:hypothetical protein